MRHACLEHLLKPSDGAGHPGKHAGWIDPHGEPAPPHAADERRTHRATGPVPRRDEPGAQETAIRRGTGLLNGEERLASLRLGPRQPEIERDPFWQGGRRARRIHATDHPPEQQTSSDETHGEKILAHRAERVLPVLRFTDSGLWSAEAVRSHEQGWNRCLDNLERALAAAS